MMNALRPHNPPSARHQRGMGLIEVLVSVLVMAIGLLGLAALQSLALRNSQSSLDRTQAVYQMYSILDAMRANSGALASYALPMAAAPCAPPAAAGSLANNDMNAWITQLQAAQGGLGPGACGSITINGAAPSNPRLVTITVQWNDSRGGTAGAQGSATQTTTLVSQL